MPRKSLAAERTVQILDAFARCIPTHGLEGTSLERIAAEAGVKRSILRHYIGNREDLIHALSDHVGRRYREQLAVLSDASSKRTLIAHLFPATPTPADEMLAVEALIATSERRPKIRGVIADLVAETIDTTSTVLRRIYPNATSARAWTVASGLVAISFNHDSLAPLQFDARHLRAARACARLLMDSLES